MKKALLLSTLTLGLIALNWWVLYSAFTSPTLNSVSWLYAVAMFSGAIGGGAIGWMLREVADVEWLREQEKER
jgi:hypothetical protein